MTDLTLQVYNNVIVVKRPTKKLYTMEAEIDDSGFIKEDDYRSIHDWRKDKVMNLLDRAEKEGKNVKIDWMTS